MSTPYKKRKHLDDKETIVAFMGEDWAYKLGNDVPVGTPLNLQMFFNCLMRLRDIDSGKVQRPIGCRVEVPQERSGAARRDERVS